MSDHSSFDFGSLAAMLVVIVVMLVVVVRLAPAMLEMLWQVLPGILLLWLIVAVLRSIVKSLFG